MSPNAGELVWFDIPVKDFKIAQSFYGELLGWKFEPMGEAKSAQYWFIKAGSETIGGLRNLENSIKETDCPILYFSVDKLDPAVTRAKKLGAMLVGERVDIPNDMGCFHLVRDKDKNLIGLWAKS